MAVGTQADRRPPSLYTHTALLYDTTEELVSGLVPFVRGGVEADERVVVVVRPAVGELLRERLGFAQGFDLLDSADLYTFPVHTLAGYVDTVRNGTQHGRAMRVAGEPIWEGRTPVEVAEWTCVEAACNVVFAESPLRMLCPYDALRLDTSIIAAVRRTHPWLQHGPHTTPSPEFSAVDHQAAVRDGSLAPRPTSFDEMTFRPTDDPSSAVAFVRQRAAALGMADGRRPALAQAVEEVLMTAMALEHGPSALRLWATDSELTCEIESPGLLPSRFAGLVPGSAIAPTTDGLWRAGQTCDVLEVREHDGNTTIRLHFMDHLVVTRRDCGGVDELLGVYALGACDAEEEVLVEAHLALCADCRAETEPLRRVVRALDDSHGDHPHDT